MRMRTFGIDEANRLVPHLARTFASVRGWLTRLEELKDVLEDAHVAPGRASAFEEERAVLMDRVRKELEQLEEMGLEVKAVDGLVDFRAVMGDQVVYLCWRYGEEAIGHWHTLDSGFSGRQPIRRSQDFARTYLA
ncbi:MAG: DUF2203 domain-containing protein [Myxococcaceae bacterium]|nr:DUF2203 domain-containing protein [Myxococcaceae bacterium]MCI0673021.1 DUF2203 domain-containing protein [Myxococcaceae bacterium]